MVSFQTTDIMFTRTYDDKDFDRVTLDEPDIPIKTKNAFLKTRLRLDFCGALFDCLSCGWLLGMVGRRRSYQSHGDDGEVYEEGVDPDDGNMWFSNAFRFASLS